MGINRYYTLISSLPHLPKFHRADRLPINRERLDERLGILEPEDRIVAAQAEEFIAWQRQPANRTDSEIIIFYGELMNQIAQPVLRSMIEYRMNQRSIIAALRRRQRGMPPPSASESWGVGPWIRQIELNWDQPDFRLGYAHPWLPVARQYLEGGDAVALEQHLMDRTWNYLDRIESHYEFRFEAVLAYLFKWDIVQRWLKYDEHEANASLQILIEETIGEYKQLFS